MYRHTGLFVLAIVAPERIQKWVRIQHISARRVVSPLRGDLNIETQTKKPSISSIYRMFRKTRRTVLEWLERLVVLNQCDIPD
jgi:hypothetical protein